MKIRICADSTCDLSPELIEKYGITITPLYIVRGSETLVDGVQITPDDQYAYFNETGRLCSTAAVNLQDYIDVFTRLRRECDAVLHFTISADMSSCYQNARLAAEEVGGVYVIDSRNLSTGIGHLVLDACEMAGEGMDAASIAEELNRRKEKLDVSFVLDTLVYMHKGGRCSAVAALGANLLKLKPSIQVQNGVMGVAKKYRGSLERCLCDYVRDKLAEPETVDPRRIFLTDSGVDPAITARVRQVVLECVPFEEVLQTRAGCTVSGHCGPNCFGILFYRK